MFRDRLTRLAEMRAQSRIISPVIVQSRSGVLSEIVEYAKQFEISHKVIAKQRGLISNILDSIPIDFAGMGTFPMRVFSKFDMFSALFSREGIFELADLRGVERIYSDEQMWAFSSISGFETSRYPTVPNEGIYAFEHMKKLKQFTSTWWTKKLIGADAANRMGFTGRGVLLSVIDTGAAKYHEQTARARFKTVIPFQRFDENGHGVWVLSCAGGRLARDNVLSRLTGRDIYCEGMAPDCDLLAVKSLGYVVGTGMTSQIIHGIEISINNGADIINMSLGSGNVPDNPTDSPYYKVFEVCKENNIIPVVAAGNCLPANTWILTPSGYRTIHNLYQMKAKKIINYNTSDGCFEEDDVMGIYKRKLNDGEKIYRITTENGHIIEATDEHPFLTKSGWKKACELIEGDMILVKPDTDERYKVSDWLKPNNPMCTGCPWNKGKPLSEELKRKLSQAHKGRPSPRKGAKLTEATKKKISENRKGKGMKPRIKIKCEYCGKDFEIIANKKRRFCSTACWALYLKENGITEDIRKKISQRTREAMKKVPKRVLMAGVIKGNITEIGPKALAKWRKENPEKARKLWEENEQFKKNIGKGENLPHNTEVARKGALAVIEKYGSPFGGKGWLGRLKQSLSREPTSIERELHRILEKANICYKTEYPIRDSKGRYFTFIDIAIPEKKIAIFADGNYWHNYPDGTQRDKIVNEYLKSLGWKVIRFWENEIKNETKKVEEILLSKIINGAKIVKIEDKTRDIYVYDIATKKNHTLIANGLILHNSGSDPSSINEPGYHPNCLTVGAYDPITGEIAKFSSRGPTKDGRIKPDVVAPGVNILSGSVNFLDYVGDNLPNRFSPLSGTSMATPAVSGLLACCKQAHREILGQELTLREVFDMMKSLGEPKTNKAGWGIITFHNHYLPWIETEYGVDLRKM